MKKTFGKEEGMENRDVPFREVSPEVARAELILRLPHIQKTVQQLEKAQKVDRETMNIEFTV